MLPRAAARALAVSIFLSAGPAFADRLVVLPSQGAADSASRAAVDQDVVVGSLAFGHTTASDVEARASLARVADGSADTPEEYAIVANGARADWVVVAHVEPAGPALRVEIAAYLASLGRVESVARDVDRTRQTAQIREMLGVLLRPEGVGVGALPWEQAPAPPPPPSNVPPPPPPPPPQPVPSQNPWTMQNPPPYVPPPPNVPPPVPDDGKIAISYLGGAKAEVFPSYAAGKRGFVVAMLGLSGAVASPGGSSGSTAASVGGVRGGYAIGDAGLELFAGLAGNLGGPRALWVDFGGRWMFSPLVHREPDGRRAGFSLDVGPELFLGPFVRLGTTLTLPSGVTYEGESSTSFAFGGALDVALGISPSLRLEAQLGNLRIVPTSDGTIVLMGATLGVTYRF